MRYLSDSPPDHHGPSEHPLSEEHLHAGRYRRRLFSPCTRRYFPSTTIVFYPFFFFAVAQRYVRCAFSQNVFTNAFHATTTTTGLPPIHAVINSAAAAAAEIIYNSRVCELRLQQSESNLGRGPGATISVGPRSDDEPARGGHIFIFYTYIYEYARRTGREMTTTTTGRVGWPGLLLVAYRTEMRIETAGAQHHNMYINV